MIDEDRPVLAVVPEGSAGAAMRPVLDRLAERRAEVCVIGDPSAAPREGQIVPLPALPEELSPIVQIVPAQRLAHASALSRHHDPDAPRGLSKVTRTR
jgi:glucosamine--fructose-6-phosphate aminotransferase (isomerizing)